jgi:hypothetical protein
MTLLAFILCAVLSSAATQSPKPLAAVDLGQASGGRIVLMGLLLPDTTYRFRLEGTVTGADTTWDLRVNGFSTTVPPHPAASEVADGHSELRARIQATVEGLRLRRKAEGRPMTSIEILDSFAAEYRKHPDLVRSSRRVSAVAFEVCWQGDDDCEPFGVSGSNRLLPASTIRRMLIDDARMLQFCMKQGRTVAVWPGGYAIPRLEHTRNYLDQHSGERRP